MFDVPLNRKTKKTEAPLESIRESNFMDLRITCFPSVQILSGSVSLEKAPHPFSGPATFTVVSERLSFNLEYSSTLQLLVHP